MDTTMYLILTSDQELIAKGVLKSSSSDGLMQLKILGGKAETVARYDTLCLIGSEVRELPMRCRFVRQTDECVILKNVDSLSPELRRTFRVPTSFHSFIYPIGGAWTGRAAIESMNISCGGMAFCSRKRLEIGDIVEVVISNVSMPIIVQAEILRRDDDHSGLLMYAAKFVNMTQAEEQAVCHAVFSVQAQERRNEILAEY